MRLKSILLETYQTASSILSQVKEDEYWLKNQRIEFPSHSEIFFSKKGSALGGFFRIDDGEWYYVEPLKKGQKFNIIRFKRDGKIDFVGRCPAPDVISMMDDGETECFRKDGPAIIYLDNGKMKYIWFYGMMSSGDNIKPGQVPNRFIGYLVRNISSDHSHSYEKDMLDDIVEAMVTLYINGYVDKLDLYTEILAVMHDIEKKEKDEFNGYAEFEGLDDREANKGIQEIELKFEGVIAEVEAWYRS